MNKIKKNLADIGALSLLTDSIQFQMGQRFLNLFEPLTLRSSLPQPSWLLHIQVSSSVRTQPTRIRPTLLLRFHQIRHRRKRRRRQWLFLTNLRWRQWRIRRLTSNWWSWRKRVIIKTATFGDSWKWSWGWEWERRRFHRHRLLNHFSFCTLKIWYESKSERESFSWVSGIFSSFFCEAVERSTKEEDEVTVRQKLSEEIEGPHSSKVRSYNCSCSG